MSIVDTEQLGREQARNSYKADCRGHWQTDSVDTPGMRGDCSVHLSQRYFSPGDDGRLPEEKRTRRRRLVDNGHLCEQLGVSTGWSTREKSNRSQLSRRLERKREILWRIGPPVSLLGPRESHQREIPRTSRKISKFTCLCYQFGTSTVCPTWKMNRTKKNYLKLCFHTFFFS